MVIEFVVTFYSFDLVVELAFVPATAFLGALWGFSQSKKEYESVENLLNGVMFLLGVFMIFYAGYQLIYSPEIFFTMDTWKDFYLPPLLSLLFLPCIYFLARLMNYETTFSRVNFAIKDKKLRKYAKLQAALRFRTDTMLLKRWANSLMVEAPKDRESIRRSINRTFELWKREQNPPSVPLENGWSPYLAAKFLNSAELSASYYKQIIEGLDEWHASSDYLKLGDHILDNTIAYYIDGSEHVATSLEIALNVGKPDEAETALATFADTASILFEKALEAEMPEGMRAQIIEGRRFERTAHGKQIILTRKDWKNDQSFDLKFFIRNPDHTDSRGLME